MPGRRGGKFVGTLGEPVDAAIGKQVQPCVDVELVIERQQFDPRVLLRNRLDIHPGRAGLDRADAVPAQLLRMDALVTAGWAKDRGLEMLERHAEVQLLAPRSGDGMARGDDVALASQQCAVQIGLAFDRNDLEFRVMDRSEALQHRQFLRERCVAFAGGPLRDCERIGQRAQPAAPAHAREEVVAGIGARGFGAAGWRTIAAAGEQRKDAKACELRRAPGRHGAWKK